MPISLFRVGDRNLKIAGAATGTLEVDRFEHIAIKCIHAYYSMHFIAFYDVHASDHAYYSTLF